MASHVDPQTLERLQSLTHIHLSDEEKEQMRGQLDSIIGFLEQLQDVDTTDIEALEHPVSGHIMRLGGEKEGEMPTDPAEILHNVRHRMINNAVKIKSMIDSEGS
ncbi:MAG: Asp-tRNA(Asn)/Glu-tRNA(Gln) amidotransferase subunit GatC [Candidatus Peribacteria bacterium]|nr:MAG: Asp-tRNA(Asn)/Glu-tRNA(Gln) amidotransferase subunit GatC [Candidatus Peribacteria bacterium]